MYACLWFYALFELSGAALCARFNLGWGGVGTSPHWLSANRCILFVRYSGTERFLEVGNARFFLCLKDTGLPGGSFMFTAPPAGDCW